MQEPKQDLVTAPAAPPLIGDAGATSYSSFGEQRFQSYFYPTVRLLQTGQQNKAGKLHYYEIYLYTIIILK